MEEQISKLTNNPKLLRPSLSQLLGNKEMVGVELGIGGGYNAVNIVLNLDIQTLYVVDANSCNHQLIPFLRNNSKLVMLQGITSYDAREKVHELLDFVYIDADHSYDGCKLDMETWFPKLKPSGQLCGHDYNLPGVKQAVDEFAEKNGLKVKFGVVKDDHMNYRTEAVYTEGNLLDWWLEKN